MIIVHLSYIAPLSEVDKYLQAHREFLDYYYKQGLLLASGPTIPRTGGIIIALTQDKPSVETIFKSDPYYLADIAQYEFIAFTPVKHREEIQALIRTSEGQIC
jgi:uncharacterized protein YciI